MLRNLGRLWALPVTAIGAVLALVCVPRFVQVRDGVVQIGVRYLIPWWMGFAAQTFGDIVITTPAGDQSDRLWRHEVVHVHQCHALGVLVLVIYPLLYAATALMPGANAYDDHPMECQAQKLTKRAH